MTEQKKTEVVTRETPKPALVAGGGIHAIVPQDFDAAYRIANIVVKSGMAPKSIDTVEKACVAIMHGLELGLTPMAALQSIAVVNGMPTIWGDGMLALVRGSGLLEDIVETVEIDKKDGLPLYGLVRVKRKGQATWVEHMFTRTQAQKAGLWGKAGPWSQYPQRMIVWRARGWALRDAFPDVLRGLRSREEVEDMVDVTSSGSATTAPAREPTRADYMAGAEVEDATENDPETGEIQDNGAASEAEGNPWYPEIVGQEAVTKALVDLIKGDRVKSLADLDAIQKANAERVAKFTQGNRAAISNALDDRREDLGGGQ